MYHGFINLNKPLGWTSHDCVARIRRLLNTKKVGHGGTLDPLATGVLPIAVGRATRLLQYLPADKAYRAVIRFGVTTATDDLEGDVVTQQSAASLTLETVTSALTGFLGTVQQIPPMYSAIQVEGKRLYDLARQGKAVDVPAREVTLYNLQPVDWTPGEQPELTLDIECSPGTYIRSLARDLGAAVGTGATLAGLQRSRSSGFDLANSITLEALEKAVGEERFTPVASGFAVRHMNAITLPPDLARRWCLGQKLTCQQPPLADIAADKVGDITGAPELAPCFRILMADTQAFLGIGEIRIASTLADTLLVPKRVCAQLPLTALND